MAWKFLGIALLLTAAALAASCVGGESTAIRHTLVLTQKGEGSITPSAGEHDYEAPLLKEIEAVPADGWIFEQWQGDIEDYDKKTNVSVEDQVEIEAVFVPIASVQGTLDIKHHFSYSVIDDFEQLGSQAPDSGGPPGPPATQDDWIDSELIVGFHASVDHDRQIQILQDLGYAVIRSSGVLNAHQVELPQGNVEAQGTQLQSRSEVRYAEPHRRIHAVSIRHPNDALYPEQWHYPLIRLPQAWSMEQGSRSVRIAVLDTGVDTEHRDLQENLDLDGAWNAFEDSSDVHDTTSDWGHGTHVAGTIGAVTDNDLDSAGVVWNTELLPVKMLDEDQENGEMAAALGILYAAGVASGEEDGHPENHNPADILNLSFGTPSESSLLGDAIEEAAQAGSILVGAAGNTGADQLWYPAAFPDVISVGATDLNYGYMPNVTSYSNTSPDLDLVAPGGVQNEDTNNSGLSDGVLSLLPHDGAGLMAGTSMAAPHVSGVIGLMLAQGIPKENVRPILHQTSMPLGPDDFSPSYGHGLIHAYWAVNAVDSIRIKAGTLDGNEIEAVAETSIGLRDGTFELLGIPEGTYRLFAWIDVRGNDRIEAGDYLIASEPMEFQEGTHLSGITGILQELEAEDSLHTWEDLTPDP